MFQVERNLLIIMAALLIAAVLHLAWQHQFVGSALGQDQSSPQYTNDAELIAPTGYENWVFVGSNLGMAYRPDLAAMTKTEAERAGRRVFHNVYIDPAAHAHFKATRQFLDPTILIMERFAAADREPQGIVSEGVFNGDRIGLEIAVKNSRRPDGSDTVWAYYDFTDRADTSKVKASAPAFPDAACESCHRRHAANDNVWVQFYPILRQHLP